MDITKSPDPFQPDELAAGDPRAPKPAAKSRAKRSAPKRKPAASKPATKSRAKQSASAKPD